MFKIYDMLYIYLSIRTLSDISNIGTRNSTYAYHWRNTFPDTVTCNEIWVYKEDMPTTNKLKAIADIMQGSNA